MAGHARQTQWQGRTDGTPWMLQTLIFFLGWMNLPLVYLGMALVIPFYMVFNHQGYITQYHFFRRRLHHGVLRAVWDVYRNQFTFGQVILDRFAIFAGAKFRTELDGNEAFMSKLDHPEGFMLLSSHVGNFELAGYMLKQDRKPIRALVYGGEKGTVVDNRRRVFSQMNVTMLPVQADMSHIFEMNRALDDGEILSMTADRRLGSQKAFRCLFFGENAEFPMGPFVLAVSRATPVVCAFVMKRSIYSYHVIVRNLPLPVDDGQSVRQRAAALAQSFAAMLEGVVRQYPYQWFNYFEFWEQP